VNRLTCYDAQTTTIVLVNDRTVILWETVRAREVNNQAWIIDETSIYSKITFFSFLFSFSTDKQTLRQWRAAHVLQISLIPFAFLSTICSLHTIKTCSAANLTWSNEEKRKKKKNQKKRKKSVLFWLSLYSNSRREMENSSNNNSSSLLSVCDCACVHKRFFF